MEAKELRIGNYVILNNKHTIVLGILQNKIIIKGYSDFIKQEVHLNRNIANIVPIPLTEEWLLKFGFKKVMQKDNYITYSNGWYRIGIYPNYFIMRGIGVSFNYVHQLQNLYFALTNEELNIKA